MKTNYFLHYWIIILLFLTTLSLIILYSSFPVSFNESTETPSLLFQSEKKNFRVGEVIPLEIAIGNIEESINAIQADISFDPLALELLEVSFVDSFATILVDRVVDNQAGLLRLSGGIPNPGYSGSGLFAKVYFRSKTPGLALVSFMDTSLILANDGKATNLFRGQSDVGYIISPEIISDDEYTEQVDLLLSSCNQVYQQHSRLVFFTEQPEVCGMMTTE